MICSEAYEINTTVDPWEVKVIPWKERVDRVTDEDVKDGEHITAVYKKEQLASLTGAERRKYMEAKRKRKQRQATDMKIQQLTE